MANVRIYIDGFNLYYRALKGTPFLWLNVDALCRTMLPMHNILGIKYFTAVVGARPSDPAKPQRQATYFRALRTIPNLTIHQGQFRTRQIKLPLSNTNPARMVYVDKTEEKGSDVNLASHLLMDGFRNAYELGIVISNDSDLETPVRIVRDELRLQIGVLNPDPRKHPSLKRAATFVKRINQTQIAAAQFPNALNDATGPFTKPADW